MNTFCNQQNSPLPLQLEVNPPAKNEVLDSDYYTAIRRELGEGVGRDDLQKMTKHQIPEVRHVAWHAAEKEKTTEPTTEEDKTRLLQFERDNLDLKITNRAKDIHMERMQKERAVIFEQLLDASRKMGELETKLLQLEAPRN